MSNVDEYTDYLNKCIDSHIDYLQEMTTFVSGSEKKRILELIEALNIELKHALKAYGSKLASVSPDNDLSNQFKLLSDVFVSNCSRIIQDHNNGFKENTSFWYNISPTIRGFLGIIASIPTLPFLVASTTFRKEYRNTFYNNPKKIYESFFQNFTQNFKKIRPLDCLYPIAYDSKNEALMNVTPEEWSYAKEILKPNGIIAEDGTKLRRKDTRYKSKIQHSFIVIGGIIYAQGTEAELPNIEYKKRVRYSEDEFGAIWVLKKIAIPNSPNIRDMYHKKMIAEKDISNDLSFAHGIAVRNPPGKEDQKAYLPCVFVKGRLVSTYVKENELSIPDTIDLMVRILNEIAEFHQGKRTTSGKKLKHGDLHAGNIIIGDDGKVKLIDFGKAYADPAQDKLTDEFVDFRKQVICPVLEKRDPSNQAWVNDITKINTANNPSAESLITTLNDLKAKYEQGEYNTLNRGLSL